MENEQEVLEAPIEEAVQAEEVSQPIAEVEAPSEVVEEVA